MTDPQGENTPTPTPWKIHSIHKNYIVDSFSDRVVAKTTPRVHENDEANAQLIVTAVNKHATLVKQVEELKKVQENAKELLAFLRIHDCIDEVEGKMIMSNLASSLTAIGK